MQNSLIQNLNSDCQIYFLQRLPLCPKHHYKEYIFIYKYFLPKSFFIQVITFPKLLTLKTEFLVPEEISVILKLSTAVCKFSFHGQI